MGEATPPENVRLELVDGRVVPVDCVYRGLQEVDGSRAHVWEAVTKELAETICGLTVGTLPGHTVVQVDARFGDGSA